jgi:lipopolysaccharide assembly outer membrane protein LptD (OstA)
VRAGLAVGIFALLCAVFPGSLWGQSDTLSTAPPLDIQILHASEISRRADIVDAQRLIGDVQLLVDGALVICDSAWRFSDDRFRLMGHVVVTDDGTVLHCDQFELSSFAGLGRATVSAPDRTVLLRSTANDDGHSRTLAAPWIAHNFETNVSTFGGGGALTTSDASGIAAEHIVSQSGHYHAQSRAFTFTGDVVAAVDSIEMRTDQMRYNPDTRKLAWRSPAHITRPSGWAESERGALDLEAGTGWFASRALASVDSLGAPARVLDDGLLITGDSLVFADSTGAAYGVLTRQAQLADTAGTYHLWADSVQWQASGIILKGSARAHIMEADTMKLAAPWIAIDDSPVGRVVRARGDALLRSSDIVAASSALDWDEETGQVELQGAPVLWSGPDQLTGDSMTVVLFENRPQSLHVRGHAMVATEVDSVATRHHQVAGRTLDGRFVDGVLARVDLFGNGRTLYFAPPESGPSPIWSANRAECRHIGMDLADGELQRIVLYDAPNGTLTSFLADSGASEVAAPLDGFVRRQNPDRLAPAHAPSPGPSTDTSASPRPTLDPPVVYAALDSIVLWIAAEEVALHGDASVKTDGITLDAADITYAAGRREVCAEGRTDSTGAPKGRPVFSEGDKSFEQASLCYSLATGKGLSRHSVSHEDELHFHADRSKRFKDGRIFIKGGMLTTCDADKPHFHFHLTKALVVPNDRIVSGPMYIQLGKIPLPIGLPFFWFPQKQEESAGILFPSFGNGRQLGYFLKDLGWYQPLGPNWDARVQGDIYSRGSWSLRGATAYSYKYRFSGALSLSRSTIINGLPGDPGWSRSREFFVRWNHSQDARARPNGRFSANVNAGTSGNFRNSLSTSQEDFVSNTFSSSILYNAKIPGKPVNVSVSARHNQNSQTGNISLVLPALGINVSRFELPVSKYLRPNALGKKWFDRIGITYATQAEQRIEGPDSTFFEGGLKGLMNRATSGVRHTASASTQWQMGFVSITPSANYKGYWNFAALDRQAIVAGPDSVVLATDTLSGFYADGDWNMSINASTRFYGLFNFSGEGRLQAIRHVLSPSIGFSYNPAYERTVDVMYEEDLLDSYNPYSLGVYTPGDINARGALTFGLGNNLEMKVRERDGEDGEPGALKKVRIIDNLQLNTSHNFQADSLRWADIRANGFSTIAGRYRINFGSTHSLYARNSDGESIDAFLLQDGSGIARLKTANASLNASWSGKQGGAPWNASAGYSLRLTRRWDSALQADTSDVTQGIRFDGAVTLAEKWKIKVNSGYDFNAMDWAPTQINLYWDLHCWEFSANWIPSGLMQSIQIRLAIKASMLRDVKLEKRFDGLGLMR